MASMLSSRITTLAVRTSNNRSLTALFQYSRGYSQEREAGSIREAGGSFSKKEKAQEDQYFKKLQDEQLKKLHDIKKFHQEELQHHQDAIDRHEKKIQEFEKKLIDN